MEYDCKDAVRECFDYTGMTHLATRNVDESAPVLLEIGSNREKIELKPTVIKIKKPSENVVRDGDVVFVG